MFDQIVSASLGNDALRFRLKEGQYVLT